MRARVEQVDVLGWNKSRGSVVNVHEVCDHMLKQHKMINISLKVCMFRNYCMFDIPGRIPVQNRQL